MTISSTIRVSGEEGLFGVIPAMLTFHPEESVVVVCLSGPRRRVGPVMRVDLTGLTGAVIDDLAGYAMRYADEVVVAIYTDQPWAFDAKPLRAVLEASANVLDVVFTGNGAHEVPENLAAASALQGVGMLPDRSALARSVEHQPELPPSPLLEELETLASRDSLIARLMPERDNVAMLVTAVQSTPDTDDRAADLCSVLAMVAYRHGDGGLAQVACDRANRLEVGHRLAGLMIQVMGMGMPPAALDEIIANMGGHE